MSGINSRDKGARAERAIRDILRKHTGHNWERVPASGGLSESHHLKGDLYIPKENNKYCIEVKHYKDDHLTSKILSSKNPKVFEWWEQTIRESNQVDKLPLLIFKFDRSKCFVATEELPESCETIITLFSIERGIEIHVCLLEAWLTLEEPEFTI